MSLTAVYLQHRLQLLERHVSALVQMMKLRHPEEAADLADLELLWQAECEEMHRVFLKGGRTSRSARRGGAGTGGHKLPAPCHRSSMRAMIPKPKPTNINPKGSRYERGTIGVGVGQG